MINKINKIYHVSDIHIRNFKRHDEYIKVFDKLYKYIQDTKDESSLIILTGDIVHSKTDVTPELFNVVQNFLRSLADICPVLLIPGNHDTNLNNSNRLDALSPIVNALNHSNLQYIKDTRIYTIGEIDFYHWSVFDKKIQFPKPKKKSKNKQICLYHGLVNNSINDFGYVMTTDDMKVSDFDGFDLVLLGDIHKHQALNEKKTIKYSGSLIQQNHGETYKNHGILVWTVSDTTSEFVEIANDTCYFTIDMIEGEYSFPAEQLPDNIYLRIKHKNSTQEDIKKCIREVKLLKNIIEVSISKVRENKEDYRYRVNTSGLDFRNVDCQNKYIREFLSSSYGASESDIIEVCNINQQINQKLITKEVPRNSIWTPKMFEFENMFGYKKGNYIDFSKMEGTYGIFAPNASGKSTLLDAITYCLFDKCSKTTRAGEVMNNSSDSFKCKFTFDLNGLIHIIERRAKIQKSGNVRVEVDFYYIDDSGIKVSLNGKERADTNNNIRKVLGSYEDFILTSFSTQTGNASFIDINQKERKELLCQFMDLNIFEDLYVFANEESRELTILLKELEKKDWHQIKYDIENNIGYILEEINNNQSTKIVVDNQIQEKSDLILKIKSKIKELDREVFLLDKEKLQNNINKHKKALSDIEDNISNINLEIKNIQDNVLKQKQIIKGYDIELITSCLEMLNTIEKQYQEKRLELKTLEIEEKSMLEKMNKLKDLKYDENCKFCMDNIFVKDAIQTKATIKSKQELILKVKKELDDLQNNITIYSEYKIKNKEYLNLQKNISELEISELTKTNNLSTSKTIYENTKKFLESDENSLNKFLEQEDIIKDNQIYSSNIKDITKELDLIKDKQSEISNQYTKLQIQKSLLEQQEHECNESIEKISDYQKRKRLYQYYLDSIHRDGIPHNLISNTLPNIEDEVNNILSQLVDFKISLVADHKNINGYIVYSEDRKWGIELVSGMEKFITSLAIRCALISISSLPRPNFIFIDEGFGSLDKENLNSIVALFEYLKTQFQFTAIISHIENMRDMVDSIIEITKIDGVSKIQHG